jgi:hypothetical protein
VCRTARWESRGRDEKPPQLVRNLSCLDICLTVHVYTLSSQNVSIKHYNEGLQRRVYQVWPCRSALSVERLFNS